MSKLLLVLLLVASMAQAGITDDVKGWACKDEKSRLTQLEKENVHLRQQRDTYMELAESNRKSAREKDEEIHTLRVALESKPSTAWGVYSNGRIAPYEWFKTMEDCQQAKWKLAKEYPQLGEFFCVPTKL